MKNSKDTNKILSFILLNYNNVDYTIPCIRSIHETVKVPNEIIVVDNASTDDSIEKLSRIDDIKLVKNSTNRGFTGGNNAGARIAEGMYIVILNNDTILKDPNINKLPAIFDERGKYDVVGGRIVGMDGRPQSSGGYEPSLFNLIIQFTILCYKKVRFPWMKEFMLFEWNEDEIKTVDWASGCFFAVRRDTYHELGGFDENIFIYLDEVDLHKRLRNMGGEICLYPDIVIHHYGQISWGGNNHYVGLRHNYNSAAYFLKKYYSWSHGFLFEFFVKAVNLLYLPFFSLLRLLTFGRFVKINTKLQFCLTLLFA